MYGVRKSCVHFCGIICVFLTPYIPVCTETIDRFVEAFKDTPNGEAVRHALREGVKLAAQVLRSAREQVLYAAENAISMCGEKEAADELEAAEHEATKARNAYLSLDMAMEASVCLKTMSILQVRKRAQPYAREGHRQMEKTLFRTAVPALQAAQQLLTAAPPDLKNDLEEHVLQLDQSLELCHSKLKILKKLGPRYWRKAQVFHGQEVAEAQTKASLLYQQAATAFFNVQEQRAEEQARKLQKLTADNAVRLAVKKSQHLEIMDQFDESIENYNWLRAWLEHCKRFEDTKKVDKLQRTVYHKRATGMLATEGNIHHAVYMYVSCSTHIYMGRVVHMIRVRALKLVFFFHNFFAACVSFFEMCRSLLILVGLLMCVIGS